MLLESDLRKLFKQLMNNDQAQIALFGTDITIRMFDSSKLSLTAPVYNGGNYIPSSVRKCVSQRSPFHSDIKTNLVIDENKFEVDLNYSGRLESINSEVFSHLLEEFSWLAGEWKHFLDEHDRNDLVHVKAR